jgi:hypothetical protein
MIEDWYWTRRFVDCSIAKIAMPHRTSEKPPMKEGLAVIHGSASMRIWILDT